MSQSNVRQRRVVSQNTAPDDTQRNVDDAPGTNDTKVFLWVFFALLVAPLFIILLMTAILSSPIDPVAFSLPPPPKFEGPLAVNDALTHTKRLFENEIVGPESMAVHKGIIYTGTADGKIVEITKDGLRVIARLGRPPCGRQEDEPTCGRPLGMRFDKEGYLIVVDAYLGLYKVNVATGDAHLLISSSTPIAGHKPKLLNDLDIHSDGRIFLTDSSIKWGRRHNRYLVLEGRTDGRLIEYDPRTNVSKVVIDGLAFPNGVQLSRKEDYLLVTETGRCRIHKYHLTGPNAGKMTMFAENLPGLPDNVRPSSTGGYWVGIAVVRHPDKLSIYDFGTDKPSFRKMVTKILSQEMMMKLAGKYGLIVELGEDGKIRRSLHDPSGSVVGSEVEDIDGVLYLGSYFQPFLGKLDLRQQ